MKLIFITLFVTISLNYFSQTSTKNVLFIGNSYTSVNNLPEITKKLALSTGDSLYYETHTPGGQTLEGHCSDPTAIQKINSKIWDFVVLQEQSQRPSFPDEQVQVEVFPFAQKLDSIILSKDSCIETMFYMTWGRKNGDASNCAFFPPLCTYQGMDSLLYLRYMQMAEENNAVVSPVGALWNYIRSVYPEIELYSSDESHPSLLGSYAAACCFYSTIFLKNPLLITENYSIDVLTAEKIRNAAKIVVYDSLSKWKSFLYMPVASFEYTINGDSIICLNQSLNSTTYEWYINNQFVSNDENITAEILNDTIFIHLVSARCNSNDTIQLMYIKDLTQLDTINKVKFNIFPNPFERELIFEDETNIQSLELFSLDGVLILNETLLGFKNHIISLSKGNYFLKIIFLDNTIGYYKIIKE
ncbi:MAG: T9SS type A sorting domain-containing protein [Flavobacteriia bacterium]|nr:T9SS type A sorting domain-containing protein [Flavobacteriia bacterium]